MTRRSLAALALLSICLAPAGPVLADEGLTTRSGVVPLVERGRLVGCQAPFAVVRGDPEYNGGRRVRVEGRMMVFSPGEGPPALMLQLFAHGPDEAEGEGGTPAAALVLRDGGRDNALERFHADGGQDADGQDGDAPLVMYALGPVSLAAVRGAAADGRFSLAYALKAGGPMAPVTVDLTVKRRPFGGGGAELDPSAPQALTDCLGRLRIDGFGR